MSSSSAEQLISGRLGVVLILDQPTQDVVQRLADASPSISHRTEAGKAHVTLYQCNLENVPRGKVAEVLNAVSQALGPEPSLTFTNMEAFGGHFIFWNTEISDQLRRAHNVAVKLASYRVTNTQPITAGQHLMLSADQLAMERRFGYPLAGHEFKPHVTIGYCDNGITAPECDPAEHSGSVARIALCTVDEKGRIVEEVVSLDVSRSAERHMGSLS